MSLARYAAVGVAATALHYAVLGWWVEVAGWSAPTGAFTGAVLGAIAAYWGNRRLTFGGSHASHGRALPRFAAVSLVGALGNGLIVGGGVVLGLHYLLAQVLATLLIMVLTYHANRLWTFS